MERKKIEQKYKRMQTNDIPRQLNLFVDLDRVADDDNRELCTKVCNR